MTFYFFVPNPQPDPIRVPLSLCDSYQARFSHEDGVLYFSDRVNQVEVFKCINQTKRPFSVLSQDQVGNEVCIDLDTKREAIK